MINTEKQAKFVEYYVLTGNATQAYKMAGYSPKAADVNGPNLRKKLAVEIEEETRKRVQGLAPMAVGFLEELAKNAQSEQVRLKAVMDILDRSGYKPTDKVEQTVTYDDKTTDELKAELANLMGFEEPTLQ
jgi:hypothetical protein